MVEAVFIGTFVPLLLLIVLLRHSRPVFLSFCWGMVAFLITYLATDNLHAWLGIGRAPFRDMVIASPILEELLKSFPLLVLLFFGQQSFVPYFYIFGMATGIGFAIEENLMYLINLQGTKEASMSLMLLRSFSTCLMHGVTMGLFGFLVTLTRRNPQRGIFLIPLGYLLAISFHSGFNALILFDRVAMAFFLVIGIFVVFLFGMKELEARAPETRNTSWE